MSRPKREITRELAQQAEAELKKIEDHKVCYRLQAIISSARFPVDVVASVLGVHRSTVFKWIARFREQGVAGLIDKPKGHNPSKLNAYQKDRIIHWLDAGKNADGESVHWTVERLIAEVERVFGIRVGKTPLWLFIRKSGFSPKVPRPIHAMADILAQEAFKKNC